MRALPQKRRFKILPNEPAEKALQHIDFRLTASEKDTIIRSALDLNVSDYIRRLMAVARLCDELEPQESTLITSWHPVVGILLKTERIGDKVSAILLVKRLLKLPLLPASKLDEELSRFINCRVAIMRTNNETRPFVIRLAD